MRMEPVFMILGQSAATAAVMAIEKKIAVQDVPYADLKKRLLKDGQILDAKNVVSTHQNGIDPKKLPGIVIDDSKAKTKGAWQHSGASKKFVGTGYQHDGNAGNGKASVRFDITPPKTGYYEIRVAAPHNNNRATNVLVEFRQGNVTTTERLNQRIKLPNDELFHSIGYYQISSETPAFLTISNPNTDGYVIADAVQLLPRK